MSISLQVLYPVTDGTHFDFEYYLVTHMPIFDKHMGPHIESIMASKGLASGPGVPPAYYAIATILFADQAAMDAAMTAAPPVMADIANFTDSQPQMLIGQVVA